MEIEYEDGRPSAQRGAKLSQDELPPVEIPLGVLSASALSGVIDNFIQREGTDYGASEVTHETKVKQIQKQLEKGDVKIVFDPNSESVSLMNLREWSQWEKKKK